MHEILEKYLQLLWKCFEFDINVFSQVWLYAWILIPAFCYLIFFFVKWAVLTAPIWLPFSLIIGTFKDIFKKK